MCGICGVVRLDGPELTNVLGQPVLDVMTDLMVHRGPDDRGTFLTPEVALGVRRLAIIDVRGGHQPVSNEDKSIWAIQNGELYNHLALRRELARHGHQFLSQTDTEVIPHLYERYGPDFVERLDGKFAFALWDANEQRAVLGRDRLGVKPLYVAETRDTLTFASELKSVLASGLVDYELDLSAVAAYLELGFVPAPLTLLKDVRKLLPGQRLVVEAGCSKVSSYWTYPEADPAKGKSAESHATDLLGELEEAVRRRLMADVPLGVMLSGGLDSSLVLALASRHSQDPIQTFSVGFSDIPAANELAAARVVAKFYGSRHTELQLTAADVPVDLEDMIWHLDEPVADLSIVGFRLLSRLANERITVALAGQGADELFGGYRKYRATRLLRASAWIPLQARSALATLPIRFGSNKLRRLSAAIASDDPIVQYASLSGMMDARSAREMLSPPHPPSWRDHVRERLSPFPVDPLQAALHFDSQIGLPDHMLHYFDRMSMAESLEVRVPFLDHKVVEYAATIPAALKLHGRTGKYILRLAARGVVPSAVIERPKRGFFHNAVDYWMAMNSPRLIETYLHSGRKTAGLVEDAAVARLHASRRLAVSRSSLALIMLEVWLSTYLPRAQQASKLATAA